MWKGLFVGVLTLTMTSASWADDTGRNVALRSRASADVGSASVMLTNARIARIKSMLRLTPAQERHWPPVEAALRNIMRQRPRNGSLGGDVAERGRGDGAVNVDTARLREFGSVAMPLIMTLDEDQKRDALKLARAIGLANVASLF